MWLSVVNDIFCDTDVKASGILLDLFFDPEDGGNVFLRNIS
jgi:hypothetical protein